MLAADLSRPIPGSILGRPIILLDTQRQAVAYPLLPSPQTRNLKDTMATPLILYATMTGNTLEAVNLLARRLGETDLGAAVIMPMATYNPLSLSSQSLVFFLTSTFGNGDPPDSAFAFWDILRKADDLSLKNLRFSVAAFGDSAYPRFCQYGKDLNARLIHLGAISIVPIATCDVDWEETFDDWLDQVTAALAKRSPTS